MNPLDVTTPDGVREAFISGEFKRLVKYDAGMGEVEKKHILASADQILKLAEQSIQAQYDVPAALVSVFVMTIVSPMHAMVYNYSFASKEDAISSANWYSYYAGWRKEKDKDPIKIHEECESFILRMLDSKSGDFLLVTDSRLSFISLAPNPAGA